MNALRELLRRHAWVGWVLALALMGLSIVLYTRLSGRNDPYSVERLSQTVTIKDIESGDEWTMPRGVMEAQLRERGLGLSAKEGLPNPKTGKPTGFPRNSEWEETVQRIARENDEIVARQKQRGAGGAPAPATGGGT